MPKFVLARPQNMKLCGDMYKFYCPACKEVHWIAVGPRSIWGTNIVWGFNKDVDKPTIYQSFLVTRPVVNGEKRCHSFIRDGYIRYLDDCTHDLAGKTVELPEFPKELINER